MPITVSGKPKAMLLYPGNDSNNDFKNFRTEDYFKSEEEINPIQHQCKMGFVSILDEDNNLSKNVGKDVLKLLEEEVILQKKPIQKTG